MSLRKWWNERVGFWSMLVGRFVVWGFDRPCDFAEVDDEALCEQGGVVQPDNTPERDNEDDRAAMSRRLMELHRKAARRKRDYYPKGVDTPDMMTPKELKKPCVGCDNCTCEDK